MFDGIWLEQVQSADFLFTLQNGKHWNLDFFNDIFFLSYPCVCTDFGFLRWLLFWDRWFKHMVLFGVGFGFGWGSQLVCFFFFFLWKAHVFNFVFGLQQVINVHLMGAALVNIDYMLCMVTLSCVSQCLLFISVDGIVLCAETSCWNCWALRGRHLGPVQSHWLSTSEQSAQELRSSSGLVSPKVAPLTHS